MPCAAAIAMERTISTIFDDHQAANRALGALLAQGFTRDDVSVLMSTDTRARFYPEGGEGVGLGAGVGAILGSLIALASAPPFGLMVAGPLTAALSGAALGAASGGLVGALVDLGIPKEQAVIYEERLGRGGVMVAVRARTREQVRTAESVLLAKGGKRAKEQLHVSPSL